MASNWETMEAMTDFVFLGSKIIADGDYSHKMKRRLLHGSKAMTNLYYVLKTRDITLLTKVHMVKAMTFPVLWPLLSFPPRQHIKKQRHYFADKSLSSQSYGFSSSHVWMWITINCGKF